MTLGSISVVCISVVSVLANSGVEKSGTGAYLENEFHVSRDYKQHKLASKNDNYFSKS